MTMAFPPTATKTMAKKSNPYISSKCRGNWKGFCRLMFLGQEVLRSSVNSSSADDDDDDDSILIYIYLLNKQLITNYRLLNLVFRQ